MLSATGGPLKNSGEERSSDLLWLTGSRSRAGVGPYRRGEKPCDDYARFAISLWLLGCLFALPAAADTTFFSTGDPDGKIATATRPDAAGFEIESADDFVLTHSTSITDATFTGLLPSGASPVEVVVEIYRVFPKDLDVGRTSGPPTFSTPQAPTRVNSPSDVALDSRDFCKRRPHLRDPVC